MTIHERVHRIKIQAHWHAATAAAIRRDLDNIVHKEARDEAAPGKLGNLHRDEIFHAALADDLMWVVANAHRLDGIENADPNPSAENKAEQTADDPMAMPPLPPSYDDATRRRLYILRAVWDGKPKNAAWITKAINEAYGETFTQDSISKTMGHLYSRSKSIIRATDVGIGYYIIDPAYKANNCCQ